MNSKVNYLIWDLPLRLFHWALVITFVALWVTAELGSEYMQYHMYCGYFMLFLMCFRLIWGFIGPRHARFSSFFPTPSRIRSYLSKPSSKPAGHNPLGACMVFLMLLLLTLQAVSGLFISDDVFSSGPYYGSVGGDLEKIFNRLHDVCFTLLQICVGLHLAAMAFYKVGKGINLVLPMLTGKKSSMEVNQKDAIASSKTKIAIIVALCAAAFIYWLVIVNAPVIEDYYYY